MAQPTKPVVSSVWASTAPDNVTPTDAFIAAGWPQSTTPPSRGRFNWLLNYLYNGVRYFSRRGIADYDAAETYMTNDKTMGPDGLTYISLVDNNIAHTPASSPTQWQRWGFAQSEFSSSLAANGYQKLPNGLIIQWGAAATVSGGAATVAFPIPFPNAVLSRVANTDNATSNATAYTIASGSGSNTSQIWWCSSSSGGIGFNWVVIGF